MNINGYNWRQKEAILQHQSIMSSAHEDDSSMPLIAIESCRSFCWSKTSDFSSPLCSVFQWRREKTVEGKFKVFNFVCGARELFSEDCYFQFSHANNMSKTQRTWLVFRGMEKLLPFKSNLETHKRLKDNLSQSLCRTRENLMCW